MSASNMEILGNRQREYDQRSQRPRSESAKGCRTLPETKNSAHGRYHETMRKLDCTVQSFDNDTQDMHNTGNDGIQKAWTKDTRLCTPGEPQRWFRQSKVTTQVPLSRHHLPPLGPLRASVLAAQYRHRHLTAPEESD